MVKLYLLSPFILNFLIGATIASVAPKLHGTWGKKKKIKGERSAEELNLGIAAFYDRSSTLWEDVWGEHMHHGYYVPENRTDHQQAQIDLIDEVLKRGDVSKVNAMVDVGCGIGGSSRHISKKYGCTSQAITISPYQVKRGNELCKEQDLDSKVVLMVADALNMPFNDNSFDLVWCLESGEHMPNKQEFVKELYRVATPGGRIFVVTWCHRVLEENEEQLTKKELKLLRKINNAYYMPQWCSLKDYGNLFQEVGAVDIQLEDWSYVIAPFWKAVIKSSLSVRSVWGLMKSGYTTMRAAYTMLLMLRGYKMGLIKYGLVTCKKN